MGPHPEFWTSPVGAFPEGTPRNATERGIPFRLPLTCVPRPVAAVGWLARGCGLLKIASLVSTLIVHSAPAGLAATFQGFNAAPFYSIIGAVSAPTVPTALLVSFDGPVAADTFISITTSDPSRLSVPGGGVTIQAGQSSAPVVVSSLALGTVTVTAYFEDVQSSRTVDVVSEIPIVPNLNIELVSGEVRLTWPTWATGYLLEASTNLIDPEDWNVLSVDHGILGTNYFVTDTLNGSKRFYRLRKP